eukprot:360309-Chlamydomonas_euryale.AAC.4
MERVQCMLPAALHAYITAAQPIPPSSCFACPRHAAVRSSACSCVHARRATWTPMPVPCSPQVSVGSLWPA